MKIYLPFIVALWLLSSFSTLGQTATYGKLKGKIIDKDNQLPLWGAVVMLTSEQLSTQTDSNGIFVFNRVPSGLCAIQVKLLGYQNSIETNLQIPIEKTLFVTVELEKQMQTLSEVSVQTNKFSQNRLTPISTYSFSREEISLNPGAQGDIFRAIGMLPGVSSSGGIYSAIAVRGQGVRDNVYMVDDIPLTEVGHLEGNSFFNDPNGGRFSIFAPRVIEKAVFQGGGFGPEFGRRSASALGLTIKEGNAENLLIDGQVDLLGLNVNFDGPSKLLKNTKVFASARYQNFVGLVNVVGLKDLGLPAYADFILKTSTQINSKYKLNFIGMICPESFVRTIDNVYQDKKLNLPYLPNFKRNKMVFGLNLSAYLNPKSSIKHVLYYTQYNSEVKVGKAYPSIDSNGVAERENMPFIENIQSQSYSEKKWGYRAIYTYHFNNQQKIIAGIEADILTLYNNRTLLHPDTSFVFRRQQLLFPNQLFQVISPEFINANFQQNAINSSGFLNYASTLFKRLNLNLGLRYDYSGFSKQQVLSPRLSGSYALRAKHQLSFGMGLYYQDPVYSDISDQPNNNILKMEEVRQVILSYQWHIQPHLIFTFEGWYKDFNHLVSNPIEGAVIKSNQAKAYGRGLDLHLQQRLIKKFHGMLSYSYMQSSRNENDGLGWYPVMYSQPHQFNILLSYKLSNKWLFSGKYRYATGRPKDDFIIHKDVLPNSSSLRYSKELIGRNQARLPDFSSLDLRVNYNFRFKTAYLTVFFDVVNVFNKQIANAESFNYIGGINYYDGLAIFPTGGLKFEF
jgi:hypothetical protein